MAFLLVAIAGAGRHAEQAVFRVDGVEPAVLAEAHPADVVADGLGLPAGDGRLQHGEVGLAAGAREGGGDVVLMVFRRGQLQDQHVLGQPSLVAGHDRGDAQRVALLAQQGVAAIARAIGPDLAAFGVVDDVLGLVAGPGHVLLTGRQRRAEGVDGGDEEAVIADGLQRGLAHARHHPHGDGHIGAVGDLDAQRGDLRAQRPHAERHHIQGAAAHRALEQGLQRFAHLGRIGPVVGRAGVDLLLRADEGAALHARHVLGIGGGVEGVRALCRGSGG